MAKKKRPVLGHDLIALERARQVAEEGYDSKHDDEHDCGELALAGAAYAAAAAGEQVFTKTIRPNHVGFRDAWPWGGAYDKRPVNARTGEMLLENMKDDERVRLLTKAGALIAAEIDRLQRQRKKNKK